MPQHHSQKNSMAMMALLALVMMTSACATSSMPVARQLKSGEVNLASTVDTSGTPRVGVRSAIGVAGASDVSVSASTNLMEWTVGGGGRVYLADWLTLGSEVSYRLNLTDLTEDILFDESNDALHELRSSSRMTFQHTFCEGSTAYGGAELLLLWGQRAGSDTFDHRYAAMGLFGGGEVMLSKNVGLQSELVVRPMWRDFTPRPGEGYDTIVGEPNAYAAMRTVQASVGLSFYW